MSEITNLDKQLESIIQRSPLCDEIHKDWPQIYERIPIKIVDILQNVYDKSLDYVVEDVLNPTVKETIEQFSSRLQENFKSFKDSPPFTIVRVSELLLSPKLYYSTPEKFLRALQSALRVSSTIQDYTMISSISPVNRGISNGGEITTGDITIGDATMCEQTLADVTVNDAPIDNETSIIISTDDSKSVVLNRIDWLTEENIKEIESRDYLINEFPINDEYSNNFDNSNFNNNESIG
ncbi:hypothetical protein WICMUC_005356 [Wickerhamomyces mucosus]|uniref:Uncharacterized protein n=1 Tax=Wickerhamomyces mucosus TaxID=1378264 RepID=A0A9P8T643_9ASCO|nr:hypothetical protein WICMUC_005356 [Wickerhamomyces mucosus]